MLNFIIAKIPIITYMASLILIVPIFTGAINVKTIKTSPLFIIFLYCIIYGVFEIVAWYYALNGLQNHFLSNIVTYLDVLSFGTYYYLIISKPLNNRFILGIILIALTVILWSHFATNRDYNRIDSFALSIQNIALIMMVLIFFYQLLHGLETKNLLEYSHFWIGIAVLVYFSIIFFLNIFAEYITFNKDTAFAQSYWQIKEYLTFFQRIFLAIGLWFSKTPQQLSPSSK